MCLCITNKPCCIVWRFWSCFPICLSSLHCGRCMLIGQQPAVSRAAPGQAVVCRPLGRRRPCSASERPNIPPRRPQLRRRRHTELPLGRRCRTAVGTRQEQCWRAESRARGRPPSGPALISSAVWPADYEVDRAALLERLD